MPKIVIISDTHNQLKDLQIPDGDVLIHAGDATVRGTVDEVIKFNNDIGKLPHKIKVFSPGNHDFLFEKNPSFAKSLMTNCDVRIHEATEISGIKFFFSPYQPMFHSWAFNVFRGEKIAEKWKDIPGDTQFLVTHGPPMEILDATLSGEHVGCADLRQHIFQRLKELRYHVFGHIHESYGHIKIGDISFINASCLDRQHKAKNKPFVVAV
jgi:Icc-related predicted phosphoesterase